MASPTCMEDLQPETIVITGMAGRFPNSDDIYDFRDNLFNKIDLVSDDERRWANTHAEIPQRTGKVNHVEKFDAGFFGVHQRQAHTMDPMCRMLIERAFEAVLDSGINPKELQGTDTGVFIGACFSESEKASFYESLDPEKYGITGCTRSMLAQRISYWFQLQGKSFVTDTACSSSLFALEHAYRAIKEGKCNMAIVGGCNLCLHPVVSLQFARLGVLSVDGACKSFDNAANGYARSEAISAVILQKAKNARRVYAEIIHSKTNCDGYKELGITYPSGKVQKVLLDDFYKECGIDASALTYVEAHGTGTKVGDPEELGTLDEIFCTGREEPLLIGSVKSNIGHNEPISGLCSIVKVVLAFETGYIPPNIHYQNPRQGVKALENGRMKVVREKTPLPDDRCIVGINSFGFGGANSHLLVRWNRKEKQPCGDALPRLVCLSARTQEALNYLITNCHGVFDHEWIALLQKVFQSRIPGHYFRGFLVLTKQGTLMKSVSQYDEDIKPLTLLFGDLKDYLKFGRHFFNIPMFAAHVKKVQNFLKSQNLLDPTYQNLTNNHLGAFILHSGIYQILKELDLEFDHFEGLTTPGKLAADYALNLLTLEECLTKLLNTDNGSITPAVQGTSGNTKILLIGTWQGGLSTKKLIKLIDIQTDSLLGFLQGLGQVYQHGYDLTLENLYPKPHWPVGRSTPMISPLIKWDHSKNWSVISYKAEDKSNSGQRVIEFSLRDDEWSFLKGHVIDGRCLFPATGYLVLIWETLARVIGRLMTDMKVVFEDVKFLRACTVPLNGLLELIINIKKGSGYFEISEGGLPVVSGRIYEDLEISREWENLQIPHESTANLHFLLEKDIYKEFRLRGYNYKSDFRALKTCNLDTTMGKITWTGNWIPMMDCMLQMQILSEDTRNLYVPTRISRILIDSAKHIKTAKSFIKDPDEHPIVPVYYYKDLNLVRCGGIEIRGLWASSIAKRHQADPVLEVYKFSPYQTKGEHSVEEVIRKFIQIALENVPVVNLKSVEVLGDKPICISEYVYQALEDQPVVKSQLIVLTNKNIDLGQGISVEDKKLNSEFDCYLGIAQNISRNPRLQKSFITVLQPKSFLISVEDSDVGNIDNGLEIISQHSTEYYTLLLMKTKPHQPCSKHHVIEFTDKTSDWFDPLQDYLKTDHQIILWSKDPDSGILGLTNCLRREPNLNDRVLTFWIPSHPTGFDLGDPVFNTQVFKNLTVNIYQNQEWGSYRHFKLPDSSGFVNVEHCYVNVTNRGNLSSLKWIQGPLTIDTVLHPEQRLVHVYCAAINFRDVMTATGRIQPDVVTRNRLEQDCVQGFEYAGRTSEGVRVMGMMSRNAMATLVPADVNLLWKVPDHLTLKEAVTIPAVYGTVLYGLIKRAQLRKGESILIHSGTGGVGHAAIHVAIYFGCKIFVTVGTESKKKYIMKTFPQIVESHIGNSRNLSFLQMIMKYTNNQGVDLVLNSLADDKLQASVKCLKQGGRFVEIGKYDLAADSSLSLDLVKKEAEYHGVMLDDLFEADPPVKRSIGDLLRSGIDLNYIKPLPTISFQPDQLEEAFRYMATGKHMGKVVIEIRPEEELKTTPPKVQKFQCQARFYCSQEKIYVINGGLGGFGLELIDWLVLRGARQIVVNSRRGITSTYQKLRIQTWQTYGTTVTVFTEDICTLNGCQTLLENCHKIGQVAAIFNLAVLLKDGLFENQTQENFATVLDPKAKTTENLDSLSRTICPDLEHFVVFSSVSCGRGNAGQTNYGLANSIMERICEQRCRDNLPGLAIQWGAIGDVGLVADMQEENTELVIGGTLQQKIVSCLDALDGFLRQKDPVVGSMVVAEKKSGPGGANNIVDAVVNILGLRDLKTVSHHSTLPELGMDSMMAVEIKQTLEREYDVFLSPQDIRGMTFSRLQEIAVQKTSNLEETIENVPRAVLALLRFIANESEADIPLLQIVPGEIKLFLLPGIEGMATLFNPMVQYLTIGTMSTQFCPCQPETTILEIAQNQINLLKGLITSNFCIAAHSFGSAVALEVVALLEKKGLTGTLILLDGAPDFMKQLIKHQLVVSTEAEFQTSLLCTVMSVYLPFEVIMKYKNQMLQCDTFDQRIDAALAVTPKQLPHRPEYMKRVCVSAFRRMKAIYEYQPTFAKLASKVLLFRPMNSSMLDIEEDYNLSQIVGTQISVSYYEGDHVSILENPDMIKEIDRIAQDSGTSINFKDKNLLDVIETSTGKVKLVTIPETVHKQKIS